MTRQVRRVVTGRNAAGRSVVISDGEPPGAVSVDGFGRADLWCLPAGSLHPESGGERAPGEDDLEPLPGAIVWQVVRLAPTAGPAHPPQEQMQRDPRYDAERPGVHRTDTLDWITIFAGEIELILDDQTLRLGPGDCVVQRGTSHAWSVVGVLD